ncbi:MAG TPA: CPBP family intramembrane glutamic endopeptidase [Solirubrobacteraceae bacterium]|nr:CPBP family intramembrane glutamic endopeptidase [Solirubrobacteraceae bacterium]
MSSVPPSSVPPPQMTPTDAGPPPAPAPVQPDDRSDEPPWPIWTAPAAILVGLVVGVLGSAVVAGIGAAVGTTHTTPAVSLVSDAVFDLGFVVTALYFAFSQGRPRPRPSDFGYRRISLWLGVGAFFAAGAGYLAVTAIYQSIVKLHGSDKLPTDLGISTSTAALVGAAIFVCVIAPICEEFFFRGFIFGALRRWHIKIHGHQIGTWVAAIETGILFGLAHTGSAASQYLIPLGFLGFVLCIVRWKTRSLYPCMALHSVNNSIALGYNELHWTGGEILALVAGSIAVIAAVTLPLSSRTLARAS